MKIQIISLFPEMFEGVLNTSMLRKAQQRQLVEYRLINLRDFGIGPRKQVDDTPYGGGDGMVLRPEPLFAAVDAAKAYDPDAHVLLMTPRGEAFDQEMAREFAATQNGLILKVPKVLLSGDHGKITAWRGRQKKSSSKTP
jgi:tRNA (guanine37-N1)-methyltransferase